MRRSNPLALVIICLMIWSSLVFQVGGSQAQAAESNLADKAVAYLYNKYESDGSSLGPYEAYILKSAGVDIGAWKSNGVALTDAVISSITADILTPGAVAAKNLAYDLLGAKALGSDDLASQLQSILQDRQSSSGFDNNPYSNMPAYDALGRAGLLGAFNNTGLARSYILGSQNTVAGAAYGAWADFMGTAEALRALIYLDPGKSDPEIQAAIDNGCSWLQGRQQTDGSFKAASDDPLIDTAEAIGVQKALGLDPAAAWTTGGKSAVDYLNDGALNANGSFGSSKNVMDATWALYSLHLLGIDPTGGGGGGGGGGGSTDVSVRVRVEGAASNLADTTVTTSGTALDALKAAVGDSNVGTTTSSYGISIDSIMGESGNPAIASGIGTGWCYYVIRDGEMIVPPSGADTYTVSDGDQFIFYICAYQTVDPWANKTYLPVVSVSPQAPTAGQSVTISVYAKKYDWMAGLVDLTADETAAIGEYTVTVGTNTYTSSGGQATIPGSAVTEGALNYAVTNPNSAGYPDVVRYAGSISVAAAGGGGGDPTSIDLGVAVVGKSGNLLFGPSTVIINQDNEWGYTVLGALDAAVGKANYVAETGSWGVWVTSIKGLKNAKPPSTAGWMYVINEASPSTGPAVTTVKEDDHVIYYYVSTMDQEAPTWEGLINKEPSGGSSGGTGSGASATIDPAAGGTVSLGSEAAVSIPAGALAGILSTTVAIDKVSTPPAAPSGFRLLGSVYEFSVGGSSAGYKFNSPVTLTFSFDPSALSAGETPAVHYYDTASLQWVSLGGLVSGNTITITVDHFTRFALLAGKTGAPAAPAAEPSRAVEYSDVPASYWAHDAISSLSDQGCIGGYPDGTFGPDNRITRAELAAILNKALALSANEQAAPGFSDVSPQDWFYGAVKNAVYAGVMKGYGQTFGPNNQITREELATALVNALGRQDEDGAGVSASTSFTDDAGISGWARGSVTVAVKYGLIKGYAEDNSFRPGGGATRAEACAMITNFLNNRKQDTAIQ